MSAQAKTLSHTRDRAAAAAAMVLPHVCLAARRSQFSGSASLHQQVTLWSFCWAHHA